MVDEEIRDGNRIASLLRADIEGFEDSPFEDVQLEEPSAEPEPESLNQQAYRASYRGDPLFAVLVQDDRALLEFHSRQAAVRDAAGEAGLRVRPKATEPPSTLVFVERGADVKRVIDVLGACLPPR